ncbi:MAG: CHASE3 domain-containing protein [Cytophaga sp.]|uniref:CHASE3 domain-containing protein n=1 Tax=Cytophaga sp. TaxID=29535 RepID=UPI003F7CF5CB
MKFSIRALNIFFFIALLLLVSAFVYSYFNIQGLRSANHWVNHTNKVFLNLESIHSDIKNAESGVQGYALTKDATHLTQQESSRKDIKNQLRIIDSLTSDNPQQQLYIDTLKVYLNDCFFLFNSSINLTNSNADQTEIITAMQKAQTSTEQINRIVDQMKQHEERLLISRTDTAETLNKNAPVMIVLSGILGFMVLVLSYYFILLDIKQRKEIVKELKIKNTLLEYAQQLTQMGTFEYFIDQQKTSWSNEMYNIFEVNKNITPAPDFIDSLVIDEDPHKVQKRKNQIFAPNQSYSHDFKIRTSNGTEKFLISNGYVTKESTGLVMHGAIIDITPLKKAELSALQQQDLMRIAKEKAESASQFKTRFLSNMSHEIRTPINAILGFTNILKKQELTPEQKTLLKNISISGELLLKLIGNILDISKIEEGKVTIEKKSFHLKEIIRSVLSPFQHTASEKNLDFRLVIDEKIPDYLIGDPQRISQVLVNIIGNALKFTSHGGITVQIQFVKNEGADYFIEFSVTDTGIGISPDKQEDIFESFTQANDSISVNYGGSGLGLSIVKEIVHLMDGTINVQSPVFTNERDKGYGARFFFVLPFHLGEDIDTDATKISIKPFPKKVTVLVADDNEMNRTLAAYTLQALDCTYEIVENGLQAINKASSFNYDIILMDMQMPVCDGLQATEQLRHNKLKTPIIGLTANVFQEDINSCLEAGMNAHLGKPYTEEDLYTVIDTWVFKNAVKSEFTPVYSNFDFIEKLSKNSTAIYREMLEMFQKQNSQLLQEIVNALDKRDTTAIDFSLHQYKSCVRILSIEKLASLIAKIEQKIKNNDPVESLSEDVKKLIEIGYIVSKEIDSKLSIL